MSEMHVAVAPWIAKAREMWATAETAYETGETEFAYWAMVDLRASATYREIAGSELAYCRAEVFSGLSKLLAGSYRNGSLTVFKELGDGVLMRSKNARDLIEMVCVLDAVRRSWPGSDARRDSPNFNFSAALNSGECVSLGRNAPGAQEASLADYLGRPIDLVARLSSFKDPSDERLLMVIEAETAARVQADLVRDYEFLEVCTPELLPPKLQKSGEGTARFCRVRIDRAGFDGVGYPFDCRVSGSLLACRL
ncbi:MAG: hypothetical protein L0H96_11255, partial [Humibacillus sp.]|nr:hypothetical protein [Humibacillus sp.]MDN5777479.1 hypothetical protein [Humibacillus sp.]